MAVIVASLHCRVLSSSSPITGISIDKDPTIELFTGEIVTLYKIWNKSKRVNVYK